MYIMQRSLSSPPPVQIHASETTRTFTTAAPASSQAKRPGDCFFSCLSTCLQMLTVSRLEYSC